jgi:dipeptidyl aminopeptidase/acylaminoacyl peptidase
MQKAKAFFYVSLGILALAYAVQAGVELGVAQGSGLTQLTSPPVGWSDTAPTFSPDGQRVAFTRSNGIGNNTYNIMVVSTSGGEPIPLATNLPMAPVHLEWSPDGHYIVFADVSHDPYTLWLLDADSPVPAQSTTWGRIKAERR